ncbi:phage integrase family protein, partial [Burkholderia ubonensis]
MKTRDTLPTAETALGFPDEAELAALRSWYAGLDARAAVARYLGDRRAVGASSRGVLGRIRRQLIAYAQARHHTDLATAFTDRPSNAASDGVARAIETLRNLPEPAPLITDAVEVWLPPRIAEALLAHGIRTLADLTVRIPRRRRWWSAIAGLG